MKSNGKSWIRNSMPAITLMLLAPLLAEVLPGATRFSSLFVFPVEICVWGGGALLIRYAVRQRQLGWLNMLLLALALSIAEEFLIQQTSLAPMVLKLKGVTYARAIGVNYVYLLWALLYETVFVVFLPVYLAELIFSDRRRELWIGRVGLAIVIPLFLLGSFLAWYSWTQIARPKVFNVPPYNPPLGTAVIGAALICGLVFAAIGPLRSKLPNISRPLNPPWPWMLGVMGGVWAALLYGLVVLAFGIAPSFPPLIAICAGLFLAAAPGYLLPRWIVSSCWKTTHVFSVIFGTMTGSMIIGYIGFFGARPADLYFKIFVNVLAVIFMLKLSRDSSFTAATEDRS